MPARKKIILQCVLTLLIFSAFPATVKGDMGPKPKLKIIVMNPPTQEYYLDVLVNYDSSYSNFYNQPMKDETYDETKLALLKDYCQDGWFPGLIHGTNIPMSGDIRGIQDKDTMVHTFGYLGIPDDFKIIIIKPDNQIQVSNTIHRNTFQSTVLYDYETGKVHQRNIVTSYVIQFLFTCIPTLLLEGIILLLFGFSLKSNWKPFVITNVSTQLFLTFTAGGALIHEGLLFAYIVFIPIEIVILLIEVFILSRYLTQHSVRRRIEYTIVANVLSFIMGFLFIGYEAILHFGHSF